MIILSILIFALILSFLVVIHEIGHFVVARFFKIRVEEFGLGYPPRALKLFEKWGSLFSLNWIPFGGFVKMEGEDTPPPEKLKPASWKNDRTKEGAFYEKSARARLAVILAGATVNFLFGVLAFSAVFSLSGIPSGAIIDATMEGSPAQQAGVPTHVAITGITTNGTYQPIATSFEVIQVIQKHRGETLTLHTQGPCQGTNCQSTNQDFSVYVRTSTETPEGQGSLGVAFNADYYKFYPWYEMPGRGMVYGLTQALLLGRNILQALSLMMSNLVTKGIVPAEVSGPVGIVHEASRSGLFNQGPLVILFFSGMLSINLAIMNVLPIPALDGGRAVFILLEKIIGRHRIQAIEGYANYGGFVVLIGLIILVTARDIFRIVTGG
jgi:regulator of sigma E protease